MRNGWISTGAQQLKDIDVKWWRSQIGLVQQEPFLFNDTIYRNVEHGLVGTEWEHAPTEVKSKLVENACKEAFADEFISRLPDVCRLSSPPIPLLAPSSSLLPLHSSHLLNIRLLLTPPLTRVMPPR